MTRLATTTLALVMVVIAGCSTTPPPAMPVASAAATIPDVRGAWTGVWGITPVRLVIFDSRDAADGSGLYIGTYQVFGQRLPTVSGILTFASRGENVSATAVGRIAYVNGAPRLFVHVEPSDGSLDLSLQIVSDTLLTGSGSSSFHWGPQGLIEFTRADRPSAR
jgi:hypothetical protein